MFLPTRVLRKIISSFLLVSLIGQFFLPTGLVLAQEASSSAVFPGSVEEIPVEESTPSGVLDLEATPTASLTATIKPEIPDLELTATPSPIPTTSIIVEPTPTEVFLTPTLIPTNFLEENPTFDPSAKNKLPVKTRLLSEKSLQFNESVTLELVNTEGNPVQVFLKRGNETVAVTMKKKFIWDSTVLVIEPPLGLKPGKYSLQITDSLGTVEEQEFWWGVLAVNFNKSVYFPGNTADISLAVLDEEGKMVCDAQLKLQITNDELQVDDELSTENGGIIVNSECQVKDYVEKPDYEARYRVGNPGRYEVTLSAWTKNGFYSVKDFFEVKESIPFDIERITATRIYPPSFYPAVFKITAFEDFSGTIEETVPDNFSILKSDRGLAYDSIQIIPYSAPFSFDQKETEKIDLSPPFAGSYQVTLGFGEQLNDPGLRLIYDKYNLLGHDGLDFDLPIGTEVLAADSGQVILTEENGDYGATVILQHSWGRSYYGHLSTIKVQKGEKIGKGSLLGLSGNSGLTTGAHLHFGIKLNKNDIKNGYYGKIDPLSYLSFPTIITESNIKVISWKVDLKKGEQITLAYQYQTPPVSPQLYLLGPLVFKREINNIPETSEPFVFGEATASADLENNQPASSSGVLGESDFSMLGASETVFRELRQWQLAIDASSTLVADADISTTSWTSGTCSTNLWDCINEGTTSPNDSDYLKTAKGTGTYSYTHTASDSPSDVSTVTQIVFNVRGYYTVAASTITVYYSTDGSAPTTQVGSAISLPVNTPSTQSVTASGLSLTKTQIDALRVKFTAGVGKNGYVFLTASDYVLTYTASVTGPTNNQIMRHGKWFNNSGVRQPFTF
ncbi:MAG: Murein DD-endopeptidase MepM [Microgenomates group bacterium ADurb.Bin219]|nr:MAG: Murein DD-endopeptidase MepM [Microgenomates group bacterium ADurb.Bin219]HNP89426.1 M23 family metallopeptidase [Candidatus Woesebacteria bacterium]